MTIYISGIERLYISGIERPVEEKNPDVKKVGIIYDEKIPIAVYEENIHIVANRLPWI